VHQGAPAAFAGALGRGLRVTLLLVVPCAAALAALAWPLVRVAAFGEAARGDLAPLAHALAAFALGLPGYAVMLLFTRASYAQGDARLPALVSAGILATGTASMVVLAATWPLEERAAALAAGFAVAYTAGGAGLGVLVRRRGGHGLGVTRSVLAVAVAGLLSGLVMAAVSGVLDPMGRLAALAVVAGAGALGLVVYAAVLRLGAGPLRPLLALGPAHG
jgi:putative peptidoglycan lipid II flippase